MSHSVHPEQFSLFPTTKPPPPNPCAVLGARRRLHRYPAALAARARYPRLDLADLVVLHDGPSLCWKRIAAAGTRLHEAYTAGMSCLSCRFCVLSSHDLVCSARLNPDLPTATPRSSAASVTGPHRPHGPT